MPHAAEEHSSCNADVQEFRWDKLCLEQSMLWEDLKMSMCQLKIEERNELASVVISKGRLMKFSERQWHRNHTFSLSLYRQHKHT
jgi:hypothetical protein